MPQLESLLNLEILDHLPQGIFILRQDGTIAFWNHCLEEWTGISKSATVGHSLVTHFPQLGTPKYTSRFQPLFEGGPPATFASQFHPQFLPCSLSNGQPRIQQTIAKAIWDEPTQEWQALVILQDISDLHRQVAESQRLRKKAQAENAARKESEVALQESQTRLDLAVNGTHDGIWDWMDVAQDEEWWSPRFYELLGYTLGEISPSLSTFKSLLHPDDVERTVAAVQNHFDQHRPFNIDYRLRTKTGIYRWFRGRGRALRDKSGRPTRMAGSIQDITARKEAEEAFLQLSRQASLILSSAGEGIYGLDTNGLATFVNPAAAKMLGYDSNELTGVPMHFTMHHTKPDGTSYPREECPMYAAFHGGMVHHVENEILWCKDGSSFPAEYTSTPIQDEQGGLLGAVVVFKNITERKQKEEQLAKLSERLQLATASAKMGIWDWDIINNVLQWDSTMYSLYGVACDQFNEAYENWANNIHPDDRELTEQELQLALAGKKDFNTEFRVVWEDRSLHHIAARGIVQRDEKGKSVRMIGVNWEITAQKQEEESRTHLQRAIDQGVEGVALLNQHGKYTYINRAHAEMYGYTTDALLGQSWKILYSKKQLAHIDENCLPHLRDSGSWHGELVGLRKDGTSFPVGISLALLFHKDQSSAGFVCTCRDITERQRAEALIHQSTQTLEQQNQELSKTRDQALAAARSKSEFLATMSHEIRTPLNGVIGMTDLLLDTELDARQHEMMETVKHSGEFLLTLINDILDFSKIDAGKLDLEVMDFDIRTAVDEVLDILAERAGQKNLELIGLVYATTPLQARGDPGRIRQILFNLIGNAIKFTQQGEIVVDVSVVKADTNGTNLRFAVTDTGIGIAPEAQVRLFELFTQADSSTTRKFGGTGLGLAICKQLVTLMQGEIGMISEQDQGSTFWFTIPFAIGPSSSPTTIPTITLQDRRVCIVETHDTIRFLLQHYVQSWGMTCEVAQNGEDGFALLLERATQGRPFDIALLDHRLSDTVQEDGFSLATHIRRTPAIAKTPLILLTALGKRGEGKIAEQSGFNGYLTKPVRHAQLQQCLHMVLGSLPSSDPTPHPGPTKLITRHSVVEVEARTQLRILLAEDNVVNQKVAVRMLQKLDYQVDVVGNGRDAIEAMALTGYDLIFMDCQMPEMDGLEATRKIRELERNKFKGKREKEDEEKIGPRMAGLSSDSSLLPSHSKVPIIALTANALTGDRQACLDAGMDDFLTKPVRLEELSTTITKWLPHRTASEAISIAAPGKNKKDSPSFPASLDETILQNLKSLGGADDPEFFLTVVDQFLSDLPRHLEGIKQAVERQDSDALVKTAHACKGSSRSIGATLLANISYALEMMGREGTMEDATAKLEQWLQEKDRTVLALRQERKQLTASSPSTLHS